MKRQRLRNITATLMRAKVQGTAIRAYTGASGIDLIDRLIG